MREAMEEVCDDVDGSKWYFDNTNRQYKRFKGDEICGKIRGLNLPDPQRIQRELGRIASPATKALWEHWNAN